MKLQITYDGTQALQQFMGHIYLWLQQI